MALTFGRVGNDLVDVLNALAERQETPGWLRVADKTRRQIVNRAKELDHSFQSVARFIRLAALVSPRAYVEFAYSPAFTVQRFKGLTHRAVASGRLSPHAVRVDSAGVRLMESGLAIGPGRDGFGLTFKQMVECAALLEVLHNTIGYSEVADLITPLTGRDLGAASANEIGKALRARFNEWLRPHLESGHRRAQMGAIVEYLKELGVMRPDGINDDVIYRFWRNRAELWRKKSVEIEQEATSPGDGGDDQADRRESIEGFRLYRSTATRVLRFRQALEDAYVERAATESALAIGSGDERGIVNVDHIGISPSPDDDDGRLIGGLSDPSGGDNWLPPLAELQRAPSSRIKWLKKTEAARLVAYLGDWSENGDDALTEEEVAERSGALMAGRPFDLALTRTLVRAEVFGDAQARIVQLLRKRGGPDDCVDVVMSTIDVSAYKELASGWREIREDLTKRTLAALAILGRAGKASGLLIVEHIGGQEAMRHVMSAIEVAHPASNVVSLSGVRGGASEARVGATQFDEEADRRLLEVGGSLARLFKETDPPDDPELAELIGKARKALKEVNMEGFRKQDIDDPAMLEAFEASTTAIVRLCRELDRLIGRADALADQELVVADKAAFAEVFAMLYSRPDGKTN